MFDYFSKTPPSALTQASRRPLKTWHAFRISLTFMLIQAALTLAFNSSLLLLAVSQAFSSINMRPNIVV